MPAGGRPDIPDLFFGGQTVVPGVTIYGSFPQNRRDPVSPTPGGRRPC
jgi:hypothetical protein